jgi:hypothetical protein
MNELRKCKICEAEKPLESFPKCKSAKGKSYRTRECKDCAKVRLSKWYQDNREYSTLRMKVWRHGLTEDRKAVYRAKAAEKQRARNASQRELCYQAYGGPICACCGELERKFLSLDHVNNDGYAHRKELKKSGAEIYHWMVREHRRTGEWPSGFQVLCMNCQHGKMRNNGICPHQEGSTTIPSGSTAKWLEVHRTLEIG